ncbi:uncharacterized protein [Anabrus simplex]|uniref:uncharacterized protein n=1 Tax=Anabrus simplex TaxID=316456 RepID=UPI0035A37F01
MDFRFFAIVVIFAFTSQVNGSVQDRLQLAEERARETLHKLLTDTRAMLNDSIASLQNSRISITDATAEAAMDASASLSVFLDTVRQLIHTALDSVPDRDVALHCVEGVEMLVEEAVGSAVRGIGKCASEAAGTDQNLMVNLAELVQDAERLALQAAAGLALQQCSSLPRLKDALNCVAELVRATRTEVQNRVGAGVREARAMGDKASRTVEGAGNCIADELQGARQYVANITAQFTECVDNLK